MAIDKTKTFARWARKEDVGDESLCRAVTEMKGGLFDADLGGHLFKKRVARSGSGKSGGFRTLVATNQGDRWVFIFGFAKNERANIDKKEEAALKKLAEQFLKYSRRELEMIRAAGELIEVKCDDEKAI
jgi:hypothetical protein